MVACVDALQLSDANIRCSSRCVISNSTFDGNRAQIRGGAMYMNRGGHLTLVNITFTRNHAGTDGGALSLVGVAHVEQRQAIFVGNEVS